MTRAGPGNARNLAGRTYRLVMRVLAGLLVFVAILLFREGLKHLAVIPKAMTMRMGGAGMASGSTGTGWDERAQPGAIRCWQWKSERSGLEQAPLRKSGRRGALLVQAVCGRFGRYSLNRCLNVEVLKMWDIQWSIAFKRRT